MSNPNATFERWNLKSEINRECQHSKKINKHLVKLIKKEKEHRLLIYKRKEGTTLLAAHMVKE